MMKKKNMRLLKKNINKSIFKSLGSDVSSKHINPLTFKSQKRVSNPAPRLII